MISNQNTHLSSLSSFWGGGAWSCLRKGRMFFVRVCGMLKDVFSAFSEFSCFIFRTRSMAVRLM